ncbi:MAG: hypothetical protein ACRD0P_35925, partial [Stackebrandtia sp.]
TQLRRRPYCDTAFGEELGMALSDGTPPHTVVWDQSTSPPDMGTPPNQSTVPLTHTAATTPPSARVVCMDSMGHVDHRLTPYDVVVAGSHTAECAVRLVLHLRLRGVIGHAAGPGLRNGGVSGLPILDQAGVPGAAVSGDTAPIADGVRMYRQGVISHVNAAAASIGVKPGMPADRAAQLMATATVRPFQLDRIQHTVHTGPLGTVVAIDTIAYGDERINGTVVCMGSHSGQSMADYMEPYDVVGTITNDAGNPLDRSAVSGMDRLAERGVPAAVVRAYSAEMGDGRSTYRTGVVSNLNAVAERLGITRGMPAAEAARLMLDKHGRAQTRVR